MLYVLGLGNMIYENSNALLQKVFGRQIVLAYPIMFSVFSSSRAITKSFGSHLGPSFPMFMEVEWPDVLYSFQICLNFLIQNGADVAFACIGDVRLLSSARSLVSKLSCYHKTVVVRNSSIASLVASNNANECITLSSTPSYCFDLCALACFCNDNALLLKLSLVSALAVLSFSARTNGRIGTIQVFGSRHELFNNVVTEIYFGIATINSNYA